MKTSSLKWEAISVFLALHCAIGAACFERAWEDAHSKAQGCPKVWWPQDSWTSHCLRLSASLRQNTLGTLLPASTGRAGCTSKLRVSSARAQGTAYPRHPKAQPRPPSATGTEPRRRGTRCRPGVHRQPRSPRAPWPASAEAVPPTAPASAPVGPAPAPRPLGPPSLPSPAPIRAAPAGPAHPEVGVGSLGSGPAPRRRRPGAASRIPPHTRGCTAPRPRGPAPDLPAPPGEPPPVSPSPRPPSALTWVAGERLAGAQHGSPLGTHFLAPRISAAHLAEAPPSPGLAWRVRPREGQPGHSAQVPPQLYSPMSWKPLRTQRVPTRPQIA